VLFVEDDFQRPPPSFDPPILKGAKACGCIREHIDMTIDSFVLAARHAKMQGEQCQREPHMTTSNRTPRPALLTVPGLHGSEGAHWQSWLEHQYADTSRVEQADWDAPHLDIWANAVLAQLATIRRPVVLAAHSFGCLATAHALAQNRTDAEVVGVLFVAPASPEKFRFAGHFEPTRLAVPSILVGSETDPWMPLDHARDLAARLSSAFVNLGDAGHINTAAGFGPWPRAKYFIDTLAQYAYPAESFAGEVSLHEHAYG
jgi:predicted alpha/beta hydrolase family esterase